MISGQVKRTIQRRLQDPSINSGQDPLAMQMLDGSVVDGSSLRAVMTDGEIGFVVA